MVEFEQTLGGLKVLKDKKPVGWLCVATKSFKFLPYNVSQKQNSGILLEFTSIEEAKKCVIETIDFLIEKSN